MNRYTYKFQSVCPVNKKKIGYKLVIETTYLLMVEQLMVFIAENYEESFHENIADGLFDAFGGNQYLVADHHGVLIETWRE